MRQLLFKIFKYDKFMQKTSAEQRSFLFWWIQIVSIIVFIMLLFFPGPVFADSTYSDYSGNSCYQIVSATSSNYYFSSTVSGRLVFLTSSNPNPNSVNGTGYFITDSPFSNSDYSYFGGSSSCSGVHKSFQTLYSDNDTFYYTTFSLSSGGNLNFSVLTSYVVVSPSNISPETALYYTYGSGSSSGPTYDNYCGSCQTFYLNPVNNRYGNIEFSSAVRLVFFNDSFYAVSLNSFTGYINTSSGPNPSSCGSSSVTVRSSIYDGNTFYFMSFSKSTFDWYGNNSFVNVAGSNSLSYRYTFGDLAVAPSYNACSVDYSAVRHIYPSTLARETANYVQAVKGQFYSASNQDYTVSLYFTRYEKNLDAMYSYYLTFDQQTAKNSYSITSSGFDMTFNDLASTVGGSTAIYDRSLTSGYSPTNHLQELDNYLNKSHGTVYSKIYPDPSKAFVLTSIFDNGFRGIYSPSAFDVPSTLHFIAVERSDFENPYYSGENVVLYYAVNETDNYYDYYVLLALNLGPSSSISSIYNYPGYLENSDGSAHTDKDFYYALSFLNLDNVGLRSLWMEDSSEYEVGFNIDPDITLEVKDQAALGVTETEEDDEKRGSVSAWQNVSRNLTEYLQGEQTDYDKLFNMGSDNYAVVNTAFNSLLNNQFTASLSGFSSQLDGIYNFTVIRYFIDVSLIVALGLAILF